MNEYGVTKEYTHDSDLMADGEIAWKDFFRLPDEAKLEILSEDIAIVVSKPSDKRKWYATSKTEWVEKYDKKFYNKYRLLLE